MKTLSKKEGLPTLLDLIGPDRLKEMQQRFYDVTGFTNGCLDAEGMLLSIAGEPEPVCMEMIRQSPLGLARCKQLVAECLDRSDRNLSTVAKCHAGMLDGRVPIKVDGHIVGFLVIGQLFDAPPNKETALAYAETLGIDPEAYWEGVQKVKVVSREKVEAATLLLEFMGNEIATMASANLKLKKEINARKKAEDALNQRNRELVAANLALEHERNLFVTGNVVVFKWKNEPEWSVEYVSPNVETILGYTKDELMSGQISYVDLVLPEHLKRVRKEIAFYTASGVPHFSHEPYGLVTKNGETIWVADFTNIVRNGAGEVIHYQGYLVDISIRMAVEKEREALIDKLQKALSEIKQLSGLIPICSSCKKIRNDEGFWDQVEAYITKHSNAHFSHGICPGCMKRLYGDEEWFDDAFERELYDEFERTLYKNGEGENE